MERMISLGNKSLRKEEKIDEHGVFVLVVLGTAKSESKWVKDELPQAFVFVSAVFKAALHLSGQILETFVVGLNTPVKRLKSK